MTVLSAPTPGFELPADRTARSTPEQRGLARDGVRLLAAGAKGTLHRSFRDLPDLLSAGDLLVVNVSATLPAAVDGHHARTRTMLPVHLSTVLDGGEWVVELRRPDNRGPFRGGRIGDAVQLPGGLRLDLRSAYPPAEVGPTRLWVAAPSRRVDSHTYLAGYGRPITYDYLDGRYPLADYQTVYAAVPGSAEMPSAGRPFTETLLIRLIAQGVIVAPVVLHTGVSSPEAHEPPAPERYEVPASTARLVEATRAAGGRVIAVGTTSVRALETVVAEDGRLRPGSGWTDLVLGPDRSARVVDGLISGLHAPEASHLLLLDAVVGADLTRRAYAEALDNHYLWHEFGDSTLLLRP